jgi:hypothetical protein
LSDFLSSREKIEVVQLYQNHYAYSNFVETGTFKGKMIEGVISNFDKIYSIELGKNYYLDAIARFKEPHVNLFFGDTISVLPILLKRIKSPIVFWLDAHYWPNSSFAIGTTACPIREELNTISQHPISTKHVILIDDYRCFTGKLGYPTQEELTLLIHALFPSHSVEISDDIIRVLPTKK